MKCDAAVTTTCDGDAIGRVTLSIGGTEVAREAPACLFHAKAFVEAALVAQGSPVEVPVVVTITRGVA